LLSAMARREASRTRKARRIWAGRACKSSGKSITGIGTRSPNSVRMNLPETDLTLLARLKDPADQLAWSEFVELYRPAIVRLGARKGFQPADRDDLAQNVFLAVAGAIARWQPDGTRAKFRTWLFTIASRAVIDAVRRRANLPLCGSSSVQQQLDAQQE